MSLTGGAMIESLTSTEETECRDAIPRVSVGNANHSYPWLGLWCGLVQTQKTTWLGSEKITIQLKIPALVKTNMEIQYFTLM